MKQINQFRDWVFRQVHTKNLVYNTCWEDPRCDRELMQFDDHSDVVMITSAGCNALDYSLDGPASINCIDMNPRQNALLEFKLALLRQSSHSDLYKFFGEGVHPEATEIYREAIREDIPAFARSYWDDNLNYFNGKGLRQTFYHYGTSGTFAWLANKYLKARRRVYSMIHEMFETEDLDRQKELYLQVEGKILNKVFEFFVNRHLSMCLLGVPRSQQQLFIEKYERGALGFIQECLRKVFTQLSLKDNYFWRLYLYGAYTPECCPAYLKEENFSALQQNSAAVRTHTTTISNFLKENPGAYSHYILLDHQDWLAANDRAALAEEWDLILKNSRPGTRILLRSAAHEVDFFPDFVRERLDFEQEETARTHKLDRVGTYASVYMGVVK